MWTIVRPLACILSNQSEAKQDCEGCKLWSQQELEVHSCMQADELVQHLSALQLQLNTRAPTQSEATLPAWTEYRHVAGIPVSTGELQSAAALPHILSCQQCDIVVLTPFGSHLQTD